MSYTLYHTFIHISAIKPFILVFKKLSDRPKLTIVDPVGSQKKTFVAKKGWWAFRCLPTTCGWCPTPYAKKWPLSLVPWLQGHFFLTPGRLKMKTWGHWVILNIQDYILFIPSHLMTYEVCFGSSLSPQYCYSKQPGCPLWGHVLAAVLIGNMDISRYQWHQSQLGGDLSISRQLHLRKWNVFFFLQNG